MIRNAKNLYKESVNSIIRPPKLNYNISDFPFNVTIEGRISNLKTFRIKNNRNQELQIFIYLPEKPFVKNNKLSAMVYLHSNGSNSLEGLFLSELCCFWGIGLILFDFAGCGKSEGDYITYGFNESKDVGIVTDFTSKKFGFEQFVVWGRSMGAVSSILYNNETSDKIVYLILDSPFYKLKDTIAFYAKNRLGVSFFLTKFAIKFISSSIKEQVHYDIIGLNVGEYVGKIKVPVILVASENDEMIPFKHFEKIQKKLQSSVRMIVSQKKHNEAREMDIICECFRESVSALLNKPISKKIILQILNKPKIGKNQKNVFLDDSPEKIKKKKSPSKTRFKLNTMSLNFSRPKSQIVDKKHFSKKTINVYNPLLFDCSLLKTNIEKKNN